jgi:hypothetical protein
MHLLRAWKWAFVLLVHGLFPFIWETKVSDEICKNKKSRTLQDKENLNQNIKRWEFPWIDRKEQQ